MDSNPLLKKNIFITLSLHTLTSPSQFTQLTGNFTRASRYFSYLKSFFQKSPPLYPEKENLWYIACRKGDSHLGKYLLSTLPIDSNHLSQGFQIAEQKNHTSFIHSLLTQSLLSTKEKQTLLLFTAKNGLALTTKILMPELQPKKHGFFATLTFPFTTLWTRLRYGHPSTTIKKALLLAVQQKEVSVVKTLLQEPNFTLSEKERLQLLETLLQHSSMLTPQYYTLANTLLQDHRIASALSQLTLKKQATLTLASGDSHLMQQLIQKLTKASLSKAEIQTLIIEPALKAKILEPLSYLLNSPIGKEWLENPQLYHSIPLSYISLLALKNGYYHIVALLMEYPSLSLQSDSASLKEQKDCISTLLQACLTLDPSFLTEKVVEEMFSWALTQDDHILTQKMIHTLSLKPEFIQQFILPSAVSKGALQSLTALIKDPKIAALVDIQSLLHLAAKAENLEIITLLAKTIKKNSHGKYTSEADSLFNAFECVAREGNIKLAIRMIKEYSKEYSLAQFIEIEEASDFIYLITPQKKLWKDNIKIIGNLLGQSTVSHEDARATLLLIISAAKFGYTKIINSLLKEHALNTTLRNLVLVYAAEYGHATIVETLLKNLRVNPFKPFTKEKLPTEVKLNHEKLNVYLTRSSSPFKKRYSTCSDTPPALYPDYVICWAAKNGHADVVKILLMHACIDPAIRHNEPIRLAAKNGHLEVVKILRQKARVNPAAWNNQAILQATKNGHAGVVQELMQDKRVDPAIRNNELICLAAENGYREVVKNLRHNALVNPAVRNNEAIRCAAEQGHLEVVQELIQDTRVDPATHNNDAIRQAATKGHVSIVKLLLQIPRIKAAIHNDIITMDTINAKQMAVAHILLKDPRVAAKTHPSLGLTRIYLAKYAIQQKNLTLLKILLKHSPHLLSDNSDSDQLYTLAATVAEQGQPDFIKLLFAFTPQEQLHAIYQQKKYYTTPTPAKLQKEIACLQFLISFKFLPEGKESFKSLQEEAFIHLETKDLLKCAEILHTAATQKEFSQNLTLCLTKQFPTDTLRKDLLQATKKLAPLVFTAKTIPHDTTKQDLKLAIYGTLLAPQIVSSEISAPLAEKLFKRLHLNLVTPKRTKRFKDELKELQEEQLELSIRNFAKTIYENRPSLDQQMR